jgi:sulfatase modifying factor 1
MRYRQDFIRHWITHPPILWPLALGIVLGLGIGAAAFLRIGGLIGVGVCLFVIGAAIWVAKDAEPVLVGLDAEAGTPVSEPEPEYPLIEPLEMVELPGGTFLRGSPDTDEEALEDEKPRHQVTVSGFLMSRYPITRRLYQDIRDTSPEEWEKESNNDHLPANYVSWFDAVSFCNALSVHVGLQPCYRIDGQQVEWDASADGYRLPTEAEWEYACRAGTTSKWSCGDDPAALEHYAWYAENANSNIQPVGTKEPNAWGLHDMHGNVWEWCWDWYAEYRPEAVSNPTGPQNGTSRVLRGGSAWIIPWLLRSAVRNWDEPENRDVIIGWRCVRRPRRQL